MRKTNLVVKIAFALIGFLFLSNAASAQVSWSAVKKKVKSAKNYHVTYKYKGPRGQYDFDYAYSPKAVRTEILRSKSARSRVGTVILYDKKWNAKRVRAKLGSGLITRKTTHKDVRETPFYRSIFGMVFDQIGGAKPKVKKSGSKTIFTFKTGNGSYKVWANSKAEILKTERRTKKGKEIRRFVGHRWNANPKFTF